MQLYVTQTQENIHKYRYEKNEVRIKNKMCNKMKCAGQYTVDLKNNNISRNVQEECANRLYSYIHSSYTDSGE